MRRRTLHGRGRGLEDRSTPVFSPDWNAGSATPGLLLKTIAPIIVASAAAALFLNKSRERVFLARSSCHSLGKGELSGRVSYCS